MGIPNVNFEDNIEAQAVYKQATIAPSDNASYPYESKIGAPTASEAERHIPGT